MGKRKTVSIGYDGSRKSPWFIRVAGKKQYFETEDARDRAHSAKLAEVEAFGFGIVADVSAQDRLTIAEMRREATKVGAEPMEIFRRGLALFKQGKPVTAPEAVNLYLAHCQARVKDGTMRKITYRELANSITTWAAHVGEIPIQSVTRQMVTDYSYLGNPSANTRSNRVGRLSMMFGWLVNDREIVDKNPCRRPRVGRRTPTVFTSTQVAALFAKAKETRPGLIPMMALQWFAGIRPAATHHMDWADIDLERKRITIRAHISKSTEPEVVDKIPDTVWHWLKPYAKESGRVACGKHIMRYQQLKTACGIEDWPQDVARHTFASHLYGLNQDINAVANALLHHTTQITLKHYVALGLTEKAGRVFFGLRP